MPSLIEDLLGLERRHFMAIISVDEGFGAELRLGQGVSAYATGGCTDRSISLDPWLSGVGETIEPSSMMGSQVSMVQSA